MAEDRMIRASMRTSEKVNSWPIALRFFWSQLWGYCDGYGRGLRDPRLIVADTFPLDEEVDARTVERWMVALETAGVLEVYEVAGKRYFECLNWDEHQELRYRKKTDIPDRFGVVPSSAKSSEKVRKSSAQIEREREREREIEIEGERESGKPPVDNSTPTPFCKKHPDGTDSPCRACGNARRTYDATLDAKTKPTVSGIYTEPDCPKHPNRPLRGCDRCAEEQS